MFKVANNMKTLVFRSQSYFSKDLFLSGSNPVKERVMSTPTWPVPYYQRIVKAYPIRCINSFTQNKTSPTSEVLTSPPMMLPGSAQNKS
jgi:hypothetical protein